MTTKIGLKELNQSVDEVLERFEAFRTEIGKWNEVRPDAGCDDAGIEESHDVLNGVKAATGSLFKEIFRLVGEAKSQGASVARERELIAAREAFKKIVSEIKITPSLRK
jgi:hypothetical protein